MINRIIQFIVVFWSYVVPHKIKGRNWTEEQMPDTSVNPVKAYHYWTDRWSY